MANNYNRNGLFDPNWKGLNLDEFLLEFGDEVELQNHAIRGIVLDFDEDEGGKWYGVCFVKQEKIFGRQIPTGFFQGCITLLDLMFIHESIIGEFVKKGRRKVDADKIEIGGKGAAMKIEEVVAIYDYGITQRNKKQTPCRRKILKLNPVNDCYVEISEIEK